MRRKAIFVIVVLSMALPLFATFQIQHSLSYDFFLPQTAHTVCYRADYLVGDPEGFSAGMTLSLGYGVEHFTDYGSNALIYGPSLGMGLVAQYSFDNGLMLTASASALAAYALYPEILRGEFQVDVRYRLTEKLYAGLGAGILFPQWNSDIQALIGVSL